MVVQLDLLAKTLLDAPIGYVEKTLAQILKKPVNLGVVEQNSMSGTKYIRKVVLSSEKFPIVRAYVRFDSKIIPEYVMYDLLQKKEGVGTILTKYNVPTQRRSVVVNFDPDGKKMTRDYEIVHKDTVWFQISEEVRLDFLSACQYS